MPNIVTQGLGPNRGLIYVMRAYRSLSSGYVYWESEWNPDATAAKAPYPANELTDVVVVRVLRVAK